MAESRTVSLTDKVQIPSVGFGTYLTSYQTKRWEPR